MGYADHDDPGADAPGAFGAFRVVHHESADGIRYADSGVLPYADSGVPPDDGLRPGDVPRPDGGRIADDGGRVAGGGRFPGAGSRADADTGAYPVIDWYAGYERFAGDQAGDRPTAAPRMAGEQPFRRVYARPADPWEASSSGGEPGWMRDHGRRPGESSLADYPAQVTLARRLAGLRPDRWIIAGGGLAAAVAVTIAFATAGGSTATRPATTQSATGHVTPPACVSPAPGH
jgi:hypothetical protein